MFEKVTVPELVTVDGTTVKRPACYISALHPGRTLEVLATHRRPDGKKHGGARVPRCPFHPTAGTTTRRSVECRACGMALAPTVVTHHAPEPRLLQVADIGDPPRTVDMPRCRNLRQ